MDKDLYKGEFNWHGEVLPPLHRRAASREQAKTIMMKELSNRLGVSVDKVSIYFNGLHDNITIQKIGNG